MATGQEEYCDRGEKTLGLYIQLYMQVKVQWKWKLQFFSLQSCHREA